MSTAAGLALLSLITQIEAAGHTRVLMLDDCPDGLKGFYTPTHNRIGLCRQDHSSDGELISTLLHETTHRLQHCRRPELTAQLDMQHSVSSLETEARAIERWGRNDPATTSNWMIRELQKHCGHNVRMFQQKKQTQLNSSMS